ncbi:MAG: hypothetical protein LQ351_002686 [Letrouitia transgressa]|nr:MAG: hypothetical protein LQ351_002686 [Letrouitia transgressa]
MASYPLDAFLTVENKSHIANPPAVVTKNPHAVSDPTDSYEFDELHRGNHQNGPSALGTPNRNQTPVTPNDLETSRPSSPLNEEAAEVLQTLSNPPMNKYRLLSACLMCFGNGLNDSAPGALIPYMEKNYAIGYAIVSLIFVTNAIGFISAAPFVQALQARLGRAKMLVLAESIVGCAYIMLVCSPPFPVVVLAFFLIGLGIAFNLALNNVFCANLANSTTTLGCFHGSYGIGGTVGPLIATALVSAGRRWSDFYFIALGVAALNLLFAYWAFRAYEQDNPVQTHGLAQTSSGHRLSKSRLLKEALKNKTTVLGSLFIFAYQGAEVSISGWVISFLISYRHSSPARVGYVTAGFWAGITIGRFVLSHPAHKVGEKVAVVGLVIGAILFQLLVWLIPNVVGEAVAVSIVGLLLGPVYPCATTVFSRLLPRRLQVSSLAAVSALGSSGGAVAPFFTGLLAQQVGTWILHPICVALFVSMLALWLGLPRIGKRRE